MEDTDDNLPAFGLDLISSPAGKGLSFPRHSPSSSATSAVDGNEADNSGADNTTGNSGAGVCGTSNSGAAISGTGASVISSHPLRIGGNGRSAFHLVAPSRQFSPLRHISPSPSTAAADLPSPLPAGHPPFLTADLPSPLPADRPSPRHHVHKACPSSSSSANSSLDHKADKEENYKEDGLCSLRLSLAPPLVDASPTPPPSQRVSPISPGYECAAKREADCALRLSLFPAPLQDTLAFPVSRSCLTLPTALQVRMATSRNVGEKRPVVRGLSLNFAEASTIGPSGASAAVNGSQPSDALQLFSSEPVRCGKRDLSALDGEISLASACAEKGCGEKAGGGSPNKKPKHCWRPEKWRPAFPWAELHVRADGRQAMRCALCLRWCADEPTPFTRDGAVDLQRSTLRTHGKSRCHKKAVEREAMAARANGQPSLLATASHAAPHAPTAAAAAATAPPALAAPAAGAAAIAAPRALPAGVTGTVPGALLACS